MKGKHLALSLALGLGATMALVLLLGGTTASPVRAQAGTGVIRVAITGNDSLDCGGVLSPCRTVQYAVDLVQPGGEVRIAAGLYNEVFTRNWFVESSYPYSITQLAFLDKDITVRGGYTVTDWSVSQPDIYTTTLDAGQKGRVFYITANRIVTIEGLRIINGHGRHEELGAPSGGGGIGVEDYSHGRLTVRHCDLISNTSSTDGGGITFWSNSSNPGTLLLENNRFIGNSAVPNPSGTGGGLLARGLVLTMTGNILQGNTATWCGGGAFFYEDTAYVSDNTFQSNSTESDGGGVCALWGDMIATHNSFLSNTGDGSGGGIYASVDVGHVYTVTDNLFQSNIAARHGSGTGGGILLSGGGFYFGHNTLLDNIATACEAAYSIGKGGGGLFHAGLTAPGHIYDNLFQGNWAATGPTCTGSGGGAFIHAQSLVWMEGNRIIENYASYYPDWGTDYDCQGGGVYIAPWGVTTMTNNIIADNHFFVKDDHPAYAHYYSKGGAIYLAGSQNVPVPTASVLLLDHNTIADNQSPAVVNRSAVISMNYTIMSGQDTDLETILHVEGLPYSHPPTTTADYTLWWPAMTVNIASGIWNHSNDIIGTPDFVAAAMDNYHLGSNSQAIDHGPGVGITTDIDGNPRPLGAGYDLGADEYADVDLSSSYKRAAPTNVTPGGTVTFTIVMRNTGTMSAPASLHDAIPISTTYVPSSVVVSSGTVSDSGGIRWRGIISAGAAVTLTFRITANTAAPLNNTAVLSDGYGSTINLIALVNAIRVHLPLVMRSY